jgi:hypothetical protein
MIIGSGLRVVHVRRDDGAASRDLVAHELGRDFRGNGGAERLATMLAAHQLGELRAFRARSAQLGQVLAAAQVLADGDVLHLGRDEAAAGVVHLRDVGAGLRAARRALQVEAQLRELRVREAFAPVERGRSGEELGVAAVLDPARTQRGQARADVDARLRIGVGTAGVVDEDGRIRLGAEGRGRIGLRDLAHRHADVWPRALHVDLARARQGLDGGLVDVGRLGDEFRMGVHGGAPSETGGKGA